MLDSPVFLSSLSLNFTAGQFRLLYYEAMLLYNRCNVGFNIIMLKCASPSLKKCHM